MKVQIKDIFIPPDRQRKTVNEGKIAELAVSIQSHGLLHPLTVAPLDRVRFPDAPELKYQLVAGYRRMLAHAFMKIPEVEANFRENLTDLEREEIELDENLVREELSWQDAVAAKARIAELRNKLYGDGVREVAEHLGEGKSVTADDIKLAKAMEVLPELKASKNKHQAMNKLRLLENRSRLTAAADIHAKMVREVNSGRTADDVSHKVHLGDALEIAARWNSGIAGCVVTDPPYGINLDEGSTKRDSNHPTIYHDDTYDIMDLTSRIANEAFRLLKDDAHAYFFFDIKAYPKVYKMLSDAGFKVDPMPLLWVKPGPGQANHPESRWASGYEACFFCRKGSRSLLKQGQSNVLQHDPVPPNRKIHPVEKPVSLLRQLIESSTVPGEVVIDFFGGSGSTGEAAIQTGRNFLLCEKDPAYHAGIIERLTKLGSAGDQPARSKSRFDPLAGEDIEGMDGEDNDVEGYK